MSELIKAENYGLNEKQVKDVDLAFSEKVKERELLHQVYSEIIKKDLSIEVSREAREIRLKAVKIKSGIAAIHKTQKAFALAFGKYCDAWKNKETEPVQQMIDNLMEIEKYEERLEQQRLAELQKEREKLISPYIDDPETRDLSGMEPDVWDAFISSKKKAYEDRIAEEKRQKEERKEQERRLKVYQQRLLEFSPYSSYVPDLVVTNDMNEAEYLALLNKAKKAHEKSVIAEKRRDFLFSEGLLQFIPEEIKFESLSDESLDWEDFVEELRNAKSAYKKKQAELKAARIKAEKEAEAAKKKAAEERRLAEEKAAKERAEAEKQRISAMEKRKLKAIDFLVENGFKETNGGMINDWHAHFIEAHHYSELESDKEFDLFCAEKLSSMQSAEKLRIEQEEKQRIAAELKRKEDEERERAEQAEALRQAELAKGDADKVKDLIEDFIKLKTKYTFKSKRNQVMYGKVGQLIEKTINFIKEK
jgi:hypothetical protein